MIGLIRLLVRLSLILLLIYPSLASSNPLSDCYSSGSNSSGLHTDIALQGVKCSLQNGSASPKSTSLDSPIAEIKDGWMHWLKWAIIFITLSFTLTPLSLYLARGGNLAILLTSSAIVGALDAEGKNKRRMKGAVEGASTGFIIYMVIVCIGPVGFIYCLYHPLIALLSEADETFCCAITRLDTFSNVSRALSQDGHWLVEIRPTEKTFWGLGDKEFNENFVLTVLDLYTGKHIKWTKTQGKELGVMTPDEENDIRDIKIDDYIYIKPKQLAPEYEHWYQLSLTPSFNSSSKPINTSPIKYVFANATESEIQIENQRTGQVETIRPKIRMDHVYMSDDGGILAVVETYEKGKRTDGLISTIYLDFKNYLEESWALEFWDVSKLCRITTYKGHGINEEALLNDRMPPEPTNLGFLAATPDGNKWYMVKEDGFIHVFDLSRKQSCESKQFPKKLEATNLSKIAS